MLSTPPIPGGQRLTDVDDLARIFPNWTGCFEQLSRGRFEGALRLGRSRHAVAHHATSNQALRVRGREAVGLLTIGLVLPRAEGSRWQGRPLQAGQIVIRDGQTEANHLATRNTESLVFGLPEPIFQRAIAAETGDWPKPRGWRSVHPNPGAFVHLRDITLQFIRATIETGRASDEIEAKCIAAAIAVLVPERRRDRLPSAPRAELVRRAEAVMRDRFREPLNELALSRELGVSGRTLSLAFREQFGMGPASFCQVLRLNAARSVLKQARRAEAPVARIAREFGFSHLGKFARYYSRLFRELPSQTCRGH